LSRAHSSESHQVIASHDCSRWVWNPQKDLSLDISSSLSKITRYY
jgi:hypothetical protein